MSQHNLAILGLAVYACANYGMTLVPPRKCSEHMTDKEKYRRAVLAPLTSLVATTVILYVVWSVVTLVEGR